MAGNSAPEVLSKPLSNGWPKTCVTKDITRWCHLFGKRPVGGSRDNQPMTILRQVVFPGRPSQQIADVKTLVRAARADSNCKNGEVAVIGASSGGTHALWVALDTTTFQDWSPSDRPNCAVTFSAPCDFSDQKPDVSGDLISIQSIQNYVNTCDRIVQKSFSPVSIVTTPTAQVPFRPLLLVHASADPMVPSRNIVDMQCALIGASINPSLYQIIKIQADPYKNDHAFALWRDPLDDGSGQVRQKVLAFLHTYVP